MGGVYSRNCSNFWNHGLNILNFSVYGVSDIFLETMDWIDVRVPSGDRPGSLDTLGEWAVAGTR